MEQKLIVKIFQTKDFKHINVFPSNESTQIVSAIIDNISFEIHKINAYITPYAYFGIWYNELSLIINEIDKYTIDRFLMNIFSHIECDKLYNSKES